MSKEPGAIHGWQQQTKFSLITLLIFGFLLSFGVFVLADKAAHHTREENFKRAAYEQIESIRDTINFSSGTLQSIRGLFAASRNVDRSEFTTFVKVLNVGSAVQALEWIPKVPLENREKVEALARLDGFPNFKIFHRGKNAQPSRVEKRDEYFPVHFVEPYRGNESALGFDLASNPSRLEALNRARDTGKAVATARITLVQETGNQFGFLLFVPIYRNGEPIDTPQQRRTSLVGFALGVFRIGDLVEATLNRGQELDTPVRVRIFDKSAPEQSQLLYPRTQSQSLHPRPNSQIESVNLTSRYEVLESLEIGGRDWLVQITPVSSSNLSDRTWQTWMTLIAGLLITGTGVLYLRQVLVRNDAIKSLVKQRTAALLETTDELSRSNRDLENFAYVASHDLKAPLRNIDNLAEWIEEDLGEVLKGEVRENMRLLRGRVKRLENLLEDLLQYSRAGREKGEICRVDTKVLVDEITSLLHRPDGITVRTVGDLPQIETAKGPLDLVFRNLIDNAFKHHDQMAGLIEVSARENGEFYTFSVSDDGPGIEPKFHEKVFHMFQTLKPRDEVEGSGMGLAMVRKIVERHGGKIRLVSDVGMRGAKFEFEWPKHING